MGYSEVTASAPRLPIGLDHGCAAKTWATAPPLKTVVLIGSMVSGAGTVSYTHLTLPTKA